jgi:hypothetical protein
VPAVAGEPAVDPNKPPVVEPTEAEKLAQQDEADAKALGFKNEKATTEFKAMRAELRELRPLKEQVTQYAEPAQKWGELTTFFQEKDITPEQFGRAMLITAAFNSTSLDAKRIARDAMRMQINHLNKELGEEGDGYDPLTEHPDLLERVKLETLERADALELVKARATQGFTKQVAEKQTAATQQQQAYADARTSAIATMNTMGEDFRKLDPAGFEAKAAILVPIMRRVFEKLPPAEWPEAFREAYIDLPAPTAAAPAPAPAARGPAPLQHLPLRPTGAGANGSMAAVIATEEDAIAAALREAAKLDGVAYHG